jgi:hypothetical protein
VKFGSGVSGAVQLSKCCDRAGLIPVPKSILFLRRFLTGTLATIRLQRIPKAKMITFEHIVLPVF